MEAFCKKGGLEHLSNSLLSLPINTLSNSLTRECFCLLIVDIEKIMSSGFALKDYVKTYEENRKRMMKRILIIMNAHTEYPIVPNSVTVSATEKNRMQLEEEGKKGNSIIACGFSLIKEGKKDNYEYFGEIIKSPEFDSLLLNGLLLTKNLLLRMQFLQEIINLNSNTKDKVRIEDKAYTHIVPYMLQTMVKETLKNEKECSLFYNFLVRIINGMTKEDLLSLKIEYKTLMKEILEYSKSFTTQTSDNLTKGLMNLLSKLLEKLPEYKDFVGQECEIVKKLLVNCLFNLPQKESDYNSAFNTKCKLPNVRKAAFELLSTLCCGSSSNLQETIDYLAPMHVKAAWRTDKLTDWYITPDTEEKSDTGYIGLRNLGCTCYMNSVMQQFFMIPTFRAEILSVINPKRDDNLEDSILHQTQFLFSALKESVKQFYDTKTFCHSVKDWENKPLREYEQMDADEYFTLYLDRLENSIKETPQKNTIKKHFEGVFANQLLCKDCVHSSVRKETFLTLNLQVKKKTSLQQSLESFVEGEMLQGKDAYYCEKCEKKVTTLKRTCIRKLPRHLICVLKRFDMNYDTMQKYKINDLCEFPMAINMEGYTEEGLAKKDQEKEGTDSQASKKYRTYPKEYYEYKLTGVVIHMGTADMGHYISLIMDREKEGVPDKEKWFEFNDSHVKNYDPSMISKDGFGDNEMRGWAKMKNAYILLYERVANYDPPEEDDDEQTSTPIEWITKTVVPEEIHKQIEKDNIRYFYEKLLFQNDYFEFVASLSLRWNCEENLVKKYKSKNPDHHLFNLSKEVTEKHAYQIESSLSKVGNNTKWDIDPLELQNLSLKVGKYLFTVLLTAAIRYNGEDILVKLTDLCKIYLNKHSELSQWLIWQFSNRKVFVEFFFESPNTTARRTIGGLLYCAMLNTFTYEQDKPTECKLLNFGNMLLEYLKLCPKFSRYFEQYWQLISRIVFIASEIRSKLLKEGMLKILLNFWITKKKSEWTQEEHFSWIENEHPDFGFPLVLMEKSNSSVEECFRKLREQPDPSYHFLSIAISTLIRSISFNENTKQSPYSLNIVDSAGEYERSALNNSTIICELILQCKNSLGIISLSEIFTHIAWENADLKTAIIKGIIMAIEKMNWNTVVNFLYFLKDLLNCKDSLQIKAIEQTQNEIVEFVKGKSRYIIQCTIKLMMWELHDIPALADWYKANESKLDWAFAWLKDYMQISLENKQDTLEVILKKLEFDSLEDKQVWDNMMQIFFKCLESFKKGEDFDLNESLSHIATLYYDKFFLEEELELWRTDTKQWSIHKVDKVLDERLHLYPKQFGKQYLCWVEVESSNITRVGTNIVLNVKPIVDEEKVKSETQAANK